MENTWSANLNQRPVIIQAGYAVHGHPQTEHYQLRNLWCLHLYDYEANLGIDETRLSITTGSISIACPGAKLVYHYRGKSPHFFFHFTLDTETSENHLLPIFSPPGACGALRHRLEEAAFQWAQNKLRSEIRLWDALWDLSEQQNRQENHPPREPRFRAITEAVSYIEKNLTQSLSLGDVATVTGYSPNHLNRLFKKRFNETVSAYISTYRMNRAAHWLQHTNWAIKRIAYEVGYHDLHHFNKAFKRTHGLAPRNYRAKLEMNNQGATKKILHDIDTALG